MIVIYWPVKWPSPPPPQGAPPLPSREHLLLRERIRERLLPLLRERLLYQHHKRKQTTWRTWCFYTHLPWWFRAQQVLVFTNFHQNVFFSIFSFKQNVLSVKMLFYFYIFSTIYYYFFLSFYQIICLFFVCVSFSTFAKLFRYMFLNDSNFSTFFFSNFRFRFFCKLFCHFFSTFHGNLV